MRYPNTIDKNFYLAYIRKEHALKNTGQKLSVNLNWDLNYPESLIEICIKTIAENWKTYPLFNELIVCENRCLLADILDVERLPLEKLCNECKSDAFWKRMFNTKWPSLMNNSSKDKPWIEIYIEKHLAEKLENMKPSQYNVEKMKILIELCSPFVKCLKVGHLEASTETNDLTADHIPFDIVLEHLNELKSFSVSYDCKTIGTQFYLGCTTITENDISKFVRGLTHTDLEVFEFHSSKLDPPMLKKISLALDKTTSLTTISMGNCRFGDAGLLAFIKCLTHDSLPNVRHIYLSNNFISSDGAIKLTNILKRRTIETIDLKLNPILAEGAIHVLALCNIVSCTSLSISSCSFDESVAEALLFVLKFSKTLRTLNLSINKLGEEMGLKIVDALSFNKHLRNLDIRNTEISLITKSKIDAIILENREKLNTINQ